ncbi:aldehyde dehydrogenase [Anaeromyces robustus]|uniref:Succinate-semialdehyde dehydrogenase, mitochondrial n=1 Tax=Anaeromyces robustus TaxID=1754192 RepID=A0A1Y1WPQ6_9FUNG|nr:aldehyde dehydrogenase [Anaeromyces robustus]|eukprot:ORX75529.1 aldehyde dehydrogenase [Anaeromyces robustus]
MKNVLLDGTLKPYKGNFINVYSPIYYQGTQERALIGSYPDMTPEDSIKAIKAAKKAFNNGKGEWPSMTPYERINIMNKFLEGLEKNKIGIAKSIMWEIGKSWDDSLKEVVRTIEYIKDTIKAVEDLYKNKNIKSVNGVNAYIKDTPIGVILCSSPFNYPFNETYTTLIPALIMGNTAVMKLPHYGVVCHYITYQLFKDIFPAGVINVVTGDGPNTLKPIMETGLVDIFGFIGTSKAASTIIKYHPKPNALKLCLGLEANNVGVILGDANIQKAIPEIISGCLSYNGQRCTALKVLLVNENIYEEFVKEFSNAVDNLKLGMPWEKSVKITPLPEEKKPKYIEELIDDAIQYGGSICNKKRGGIIDRSIVSPIVIRDAKPCMRVVKEEQFGPIIPIMKWSSISEVQEFVMNSNYGQQAAIFGEDPDLIASAVDCFVFNVGRVNINSQCQRGPDVLPFTGRKDSAQGTLSVTDALKVFSIPSVVAIKSKEAGLFNKVSQKSKFLS